MTVSVGPLSTLLFLIAAAATLCSFLYYRRAARLEEEGSSPSSDIPAHAADPSPEIRPDEHVDPTTVSAAAAPIDSSPTAPQPLAGWYPKPDDPYIQGYWDGSRWTARARWDGSQWVPLPFP